MAHTHTNTHTHTIDKRLVCHKVGDEIWRPDVCNACWDVCQRDRCREEKPVRLYWLLVPGPHLQQGNHIKIFICSSACSGLRMWITFLPLTEAARIHNPHLVCVFLSFPSVCIESVSRALIIRLPLCVSPSIHSTHGPHANGISVRIQISMKDFVAMRGIFIYLFTYFVMCIYLFVFIFVVFVTFWNWV